MSAPRIVRIIAAVFDLKDSTGMVARPESLQYVSAYLQSFLGWLSGRIRNLVENPNVASLSLQGDGAFVIWEYEPGNQSALSQIVRACLTVTREFRDTKSKQLMEQIPLCPLPTILRCGIAEGGAASVALSTEENGPAGYFGFCLALATRLQKVCEGVSVAVSARLNLPDDLVAEQGFVKKISHIRGVGPEVMYLLKAECDQLPPKSKRVVADLGERLSPDPSEGLLTHDDALKFADAINMRNTRDSSFLIVASNTLQMLAEQYPNLAPILVEHAKVFRIGERRDRLEKAIEFLDRAIRIDPTYKRAFFNRACYCCLIADKINDTAERDGWIGQAWESLRQVVSDEPTWRHWMGEDPDLKTLRDHPNWVEFTKDLPPPMAPVPA